MKNSYVRLGIALGAIIAVSSSPAMSRTWYVNISGTGDAPTIAAAMDSAAYGDTVLVGPGHYETEVGYSVGAGLVVTSEMGPLQTRITGIGAGGPPPGIFDLLSRSEVHGFWVERALSATIFTGPNCKIFNNIIGGGGPGYQMDIQDDSAYILNNLFLPGGQGIYGGGTAVFGFNIVLCSIVCQGPPPTAFCNDILSPDSPCVQLIWQQYGIDNFSADPQFCGIEGSGNYFLQTDSPCAAGNNPLPFGDCGLIGPLPVGCGPVKTEVKSWGAVKSMYRE